MKTILVLIDSLNKNMLECYNDETWVKSPCLKKLCDDSVRFDNHFIGSTPCMPARRDIFTGRMNFLERSWGGIEPFDVTLIESLRNSNIFTHMETDHYHYLELGGEGYCQMFNTWDMVRGQEADPWISRVETNEEIPHIGRYRPQYELNRTQFKQESDYPTPKTFERASEWIDTNAQFDNFFLTVECFDPHEPFDCPKKYLDLYDDNYSGVRYDWDEYREVEETDEQLKHIRNRYAGTLSMMDAWLGKLIEKLKEKGIYEETAIIVTADHGHLLGEHNLMAKNYPHQYNELSTVPFFIKMVNNAHKGEKISALTQSVDIMPTILEMNNIAIPQTVTGKSVLALIDKKVKKIHEQVIWGFFGKAVNITDGKYTYFQAPIKDNRPLFEYTAMPTTFRSYLGKENSNEIECGRFLKYTNYPVFKIPKVMKGKAMKWVSESLLFDFNDVSQQNSLDDCDIKKTMQEKLVVEMKRNGCPDEQFERLGLEKLL